MGIFDNLFGSSKKESPDPERLKALLFQAVAAGDIPVVERLCRDHRDAVRAAFPTWQKVPPEIRTDQDAMQRYAQALITVAQVFANRLGSPDLLQLLVGNELSNPLRRWQAQLRQAQELMDGLRYAEAEAVLQEALTQGRPLEGSGADAYLPVTLGRLGQCYFQTRHGEKALPLLEEALHLCEKTNDIEGVTAYLGSLYEVHRYLGQPKSAADYAQRLADAFTRQGKSAEAERYRTQAALVRAGEPLNRVVCIINGQRRELDQVGRLRDARVQFVFERNRITLQPATVLTQRGGKQAEAGKFAEALASFQAAAAADPFDPHCRYEEGLTFLYLHRYAEAVGSYRAAEELAPGWFHCRSDLWLAQQLAEGKLPHEVFMALRLLEDGPQKPAEKLSLADQVLQRVPDVALLHLARGKSLLALGREEEAVQAYRRGLACADEPDVRTRLLVDLGALLNPGPERTALFQEARQLNGNLVAGATAVLTLAQEGGG